MSRRMLSDRDRAYFDEHCDAVLAQLPRDVLRLLDEVPLYVEDHPSREVMREMNVADPTQLMGLHTGISLMDRRIEQSGYLPNHIFIYRLGLLTLTDDLEGPERDAELRHQIRITILHELGHYHGLDEDDLDELGYG